MVKLYPDAFSCFAIEAVVSAVNDDARMFLMGFA